MSLDLHTELAALRQLVLSSKDDLSRYRGAHSDACFATVIGHAEFLLSRRSICLLKVHYEVLSLLTRSVDASSAILFRDSAACGSSALAYSAGAYCSDLVCHCLVAPATSGARASFDVSLGCLPRQPLLRLSILGSLLRLPSSATF